MAKKRRKKNEYRHAAAGGQRNFLNDPVPEGGLPIRRMPARLTRARKHRLMSPFYGPS